MFSVSGAILNVVSVLSWVSLPNICAYCAARAAQWSLTNETEIVADEISKQVLAGLSAGREPPTSIWMYQGGSHLLYPVSVGRAPEAAGRRGGGST